MGLARNCATDIIKEGVRLVLLAGSNIDVQNLTGIDDTLRETATVKGVTMVEAVPNLTTKRKTRGKT